MIIAPQQYFAVENRTSLTSFLVFLVSHQMAHLFLESDQLMLLLFNFMKML